ncbi:MAG: transporter associated domain-containing protein [Anaeromyxobacteraceae bacterium]
MSRDRPLRAFTFRDHPALLLEPAGVPQPRLGQNEVEAGGRNQRDTPIREVNRELGLDLPEGDDWTTVAGLCVSLAGGIPRPGARLKTDRFELEVVEASPRAVRLVRLHKGIPSPTD